MQCKSFPVVLPHCLLNLAGSLLHQYWVSSFEKTAAIRVLSPCCKQAQAQELGTGISVCLFYSVSVDEDTYSKELQSKQWSLSANFSLFWIRHVSPHIIRKTHTVLKQSNGRTMNFPDLQIDLMRSRLWGNNTIPFQSFDSLLTNSSTANFCQLWEILRCEYLSIRM